MTDIKVGAEVTLVGKVAELIAEVPNGYYRIELAGGSVVWVHKSEITSAKNPQHPEPASGYAVIDDQIAWRSSESRAWETESSVYPGWAELIDRMDPESVVELVKKEASA